MTTTCMRTLHATTRGEWRAWLTDNGESAEEIWLILQRQLPPAVLRQSAGSSTPNVRHDEAIEEALCFGWIDSLARKRDAGSWCLRFTPRNPRSAWSNVNRALVERLIAQGLMTSRGQAAIDLAKRTGTWSVLADAQNGVVPDDLRAMLAADEAAAGHFHAFPPSTRRAILEWISRAKRPETRRRRLERTVETAARNLRP